MPKRRAIKKWMMPSESSPGKTYTVTQWDDLMFSCNCPRWVFKREERQRGCLHTAGVEIAMSVGAIPPEIKSIPVLTSRKRLISLSEEE